MFIVYIPYIVETIQICTGPTNIWAEFTVPPEPWTSQRNYADPGISYNGGDRDSGDAVVLPDCSIFVAGYIYWYRSGDFIFSEYSRVFSVSTDGGGSYSALKDFYPYQISEIMRGEYDPLNWSHGVNSVAVTNAGNKIYVLHNTSDGNQYPYYVPGGYVGQPLNNYLITSISTDLGNTWTHNQSSSNENSTTHALYTATGLYHIGGDTKTLLENNGNIANLYISHSVNDGVSWTQTKVLDNSQLESFTNFGFNKLKVSLAEVNGLCGVLINGLKPDLSVNSNVALFYLKPTSPASWTLHTFFDDYDSNNYFYHDGNAFYDRVKLLCLKNSPGTLLAFYSSYYNNRIFYYRSTDYGDTWSGPKQVYPMTTFDEITPEVTLTRDTWGPLLNIKQESYTNSSTSPAGTEWNADGWADLSDVTTRAYDTFETITAQGPTYGIGNNIKNKFLVMRATDSGRYFKFKFSQWGNSAVGASFTYSRQEIDTTGANISAVTTVIKSAVNETPGEIDRVAWGPTYDAVELASGNVAVVLSTTYPDDYDYDGIKYIVSTDQGQNFSLHGWAGGASEYGENFSDMVYEGGYKCLGSGNDVVLLGASTSYLTTPGKNKAIRFTPIPGGMPPQKPAVPITAPMIFEYDPTISASPGFVFSAPFNLLVDWGDGTVVQYYDNSNNNVPKTHNYGANTLIKTITVMGRTSAISFPSFNKFGFTGVNEWGNLENLSSITFMGCTNLSKVPTSAPSNVTSYYNMFGECTSLNDANINLWDTSLVSNMSGMFAYASSFNCDIGNWDTANVTNMSGMFSHATAFSQNLNNWNTGNVTTMNGMFGVAQVFNSPLNNWNVSNVTTMRQMFDGASQFNQPVFSWDTSKVTDMALLFSQTQFNYNIGSWDVSQVTDMVGMFGNTPFNQDIGSWDTSNVLYMSSMFSNTPFNQDIGSWNTSNVTVFDGMFQSASAFNQNIGSWNTGSAVNMNNMFNGATSFNQNLSGWCVTNIPSEPTNFSTGSALTTGNTPVWGTCP